MIIVTKLMLLYFQLGMVVWVDYCYQVNVFVFQLLPTLNSLLVFLVEVL